MSHLDGLGGSSVVFYPAERLDCLAILMEAKVELDHADRSRTTASGFVFEIVLVSDNRQLDVSVSTLNPRFDKRFAQRRSSGSANQSSVAKSACCQSRTIHNFIQNACRMQKCDIV